MSRETSRRGGPTRREYVKYGGAVVTGVALAGCAGDSEPESTPTSDDTTRDPTSVAPTTTQNQSYSVELESVGEVTFDTTPETWMATTGPWADMAIALGQFDGFVPYGTYAPGFLYDAVGVDFPTEYEDPHGQISKEVFYERSPDVVLTDPTMFEALGSNWDESDTEEIAENVAPFFASVLFRKLPFDETRFYTLYEAFDRLADVFDERDRYEAFAAIHDDLSTTIEERRPDDAPEIGLINFGSEPSKGTFYPMDPTIEGTEMKQYRDLGVESAFPTSVTEQGEMDYEQLLATDPEIIVVHSAIQLTDDDRFSASSFREQWVEPMAEHPVGGDLTAVREGNVYPGGHYMQGPIVNLFQTEMTAQLLYPDEFGAFDPDTFPALPDDERLFDRQRVADIVAGEV